MLTQTITELIAPFMPAQDIWKFALLQRNIDILKIVKVWVVTHGNPYSDIWCNDIIYAVIDKPIIQKVVIYPDVQGGFVTFNSIQADWWLHFALHVGYSVEIVYEERQTRNYHDCLLATPFG